MFKNHREGEWGLWPPLKCDSHTPPSCTQGNRLPLLTATSWFSKRCLARVAACTPTRCTQNPPLPSGGKSWGGRLAPGLPVLKMQPASTHCGQTGVSVQTRSLSKAVKSHRIRRWLCLKGGIFLKQRCSSVRGFILQTSWKHNRRSEGFYSLIPIYRKSSKD